MKLYISLSFKVVNLSDEFNEFIQNKYLKDLLFDEELLFIYWDL
jgi:hypothetical protein